MANSPSKSTSRASSGKNSRSTILRKQVLEARNQWPALLRRPQLIWILLRGTGLQHVFLVSALIGIQLGTAPLVAAIRHFIQFDPGATSQWIVSGSASAVLAWAVGIWLSTPRVLNLATLRARGMAIRAGHRAKQDPSLGIKLYREALRQTVISSSRTDIERKITNLELAQTRGATVACSPPKTKAAPVSRNDATIIEEVTPAGSHEDTDAESVGPDGRYLLHRELGRGGMAVVFLASDSVLGRDVALKQLPTRMNSEKELTERFRQEARALASLSHSNVVQIFDLFDHQEQLWIAMEFVCGGDLADQMDERGAFSPREAFEVVVPIASGLAAAHARGIVHRDIKPMNILISEDRTPKLTDFGLAKLVESSVHTVAGAAMGSPPYMSPEQAAGKPVDKATDMYSLGITLYELLSNRTPFEGDITQVMAQHITQAPPPLAEFCTDLAPNISELVTSMLEKDPKHRLSDMNQFISRVDKLRVPK